MPERFRPLSWPTRAARVCPVPDCLLLLRLLRLQAARPTSITRRYVLRPCLYDVCLSETTQALYDAQLTMRALQEENRRLQTENAAALQLARSLRSGKGKGKKKKADPPSEKDESPPPAPTPNELVPLLNLIRFHGRKYSVCVRPWPPLRMTWSYPERPAINPLDREMRYLLHRNVDDLDISIANDQAMCAELYDILPSFLHHHMTNEFLIKEVCNSESAHSSLTPPLLIRSFL